MHHQTDYLIIGGGASGIAFADTLLAETDATITIVDRGHSPGGHWNYTYPFVRLHQPSAVYGVASKRLGRDAVDTSGGNKGLNELAGAGEIKGYFQQIVDRTLLPSGRVTYFANCDYLDKGKVVSKVSGGTTAVNVAKKTVHSAFLTSATPETHTPKFSVDPGVRLVTPAGLAEMEHAASQYVIAGSGKTAVDVCLWLLENQVDPGRILWVMPRDSWFLDRRFFQTSEEYFDFRLNYSIKESEAIINADDVEELFKHLDADEILLRLDKEITPTSFKCATVTKAELAALRNIKNVVRKGYVTSIEKGQMHLTGGTKETHPEAIYVDCTASAISDVKSRPVFEGDNIYVQGVRACQPTFSAAFLAFLESTGRNEKEKNALTVPVNYPIDAEDWVRQKFISGQNQFAWIRDPEISAWLKTCRLDGFTASKRPTELSEAQEKLAQRYKDSVFPMAMKLKTFVDQVGLERRSRRAR